MQRKDKLAIRELLASLKLGGSSSTMSSYVARTRVERRKYLLIHRPFPRELFDQGQKPGLELSLKVWRREHIDWKTIENSLFHNSCVTDVES